MLRHILLRLIPYFRINGKGRFEDLTLPSVILIEECPDFFARIQARDDKSVV